MIDYRYNKETTSTEKEILRITADEVKLGELPHHVFMVKMYDSKLQQYRAFCGGSIITEKRVLSSANCFMSNRKKIRIPLSVITVVAGILETVVNKTESHPQQQWRSVEKIYSQRFFKFPSYDLAIVQIDTAFEFNKWVNKIPHGSRNYDFDGVCLSIVLRPTTSWAEKKTIFSEQLQMITRHECEKILLRSCRLFYCTAYKTRYIYAEVEGAGLICYGTKDPEDKGAGVLVGITSLINIQLPTLHHKTTLFHAWIEDEGVVLKPDNTIQLLCLYILLFIKLL